jgi:hypothetical protein
VINDIQRGPLYPLHDLIELMNEKPRLQLSYSIVVLPKEMLERNNNLGRCDQAVEIRTRLRYTNPLLAWSGSLFMQSSRRLDVKVHQVTLFCTIEAMRAYHTLRKWPTIPQLLHLAPARATHQIAITTETGIRGVVAGGAAIKAVAEGGLDPKTVASAKEMWVGGNGSQ